MKNILLPSFALAMALSSMAAEPADEIKAAAKALSHKANYTWKSESRVSGVPFNPGPTIGKTEKNGFTVLSQEINGQTIQAVLKGTNGVVKTDDGWLSARELSQPGGGEGGGFNPLRMMGRLLLTAKSPSQQIENLVEKAKELKKDAAGVISGNLTPEDAKEMMSFGRRGRPGSGSGGGASSPPDAKGSLKVWLKNGVPAKYELTLSGTISFGGEERAIERLTIVEIEDVGTTQVQVPEGAREKLTGGDTKP